MQEPHPFSILLAEDDEDSRELLVSVLALKFPGATLHAANNGKTGLECFRKCSPAIVITDVNMPEMDGIRMAREIRSIDDAVILVVLTAFSDKNILENSAAADIRIDHYILKPVDYEKLFAIVGQYLP